jgi:hypothetical protein
MAICYAPVFGAGLRRIIINICYARAGFKRFCINVLKSPRGAALKLLADPALRGVDRVAVTDRAFRASVELSAISEPEAVERAQLPLAGSWKNPPTKKGGHVSGRSYLLLKPKLSPFVGFAFSERNALHHHEVSVHSCAPTY